MNFLSQVITNFGSKNKESLRKFDLSTVGLDISLLASLLSFKIPYNVQYFHIY